MCPKIELLQKYIDQNCLFRCNPNVEYSTLTPIGRVPGGGMFNPKGNTINFFLRRLMYHNYYLRMTSELIVKKIIGEFWGGSFVQKVPFQLAAVEHAGVPLALGIQEEFKKKGFSINMFSVRKERKNYGLFHYIEGIPNTYPVIVIDELFNSGGSVWRAMLVIIEELGLEIAPKFATILSLNTKEKTDTFKITLDGNKWIAPLYLFTKDDFNYSYDKDKYWIPEDVI